MIPGDNKSKLILILVIILAIAIIFLGYAISIKPSSVSFKYKISNMVDKDSGKFSTSMLGLDTGAVVSYIMGVFMYDTKEEEQE